MIFLLAICIGVKAATINAQSLFKVDNSDIGTLLDGHLIMELTGHVQLAQCARRCSDIPRCLSFNYAYIQGICQLNSAMKSEVDDSHILKDSSYIYVDISSWPQVGNVFISNSKCYIYCPDNEE